MRFIRKIIYDLGFRPMFGSIFYSSSLDLQYVTKDALKKVRW